MSAQSELAGRRGRAMRPGRHKVAFGAANRSERQPPTLIDRLQEYRPLGQILRNFHLSFRNRMIYLPIGKVANSSIKAFLYQAEARSLGVPMPKRFMPTQRTVHSPYQGPLLKAYQLPVRLLERALMSDKYFKFVFVRNPYDRLLSCFLDRVSKEGSGPNRHALELARKRSVDQLTFEEFAFGLERQTIKEMDPHWRPQYYEAGFDVLTYSFIGRFESLEKDLAHVISTIYGKEALKSLQLNENYSPATTAANSRLKEYYTDAALAVVNKVYERDFTQFGYKVIERVQDIDNT